MIHVYITALTQISTSSPVFVRCLCWLVCLGPFSSVQFSCSVMSNSLWPHGLQHSRLPVHQTFGPLSMWIYLSNFPDWPRLLYFMNVLCRIYQVFCSKRGEIYILHPRETFYQIPSKVLSLSFYHEFFSWFLTYSPLPPVLPRGLWW